MHKILLVLPLTLALSGINSSAFAGQPADDAKVHFQAIGAGDVALIMRAYSGNAHFNWVGGPLDGTYNGTDSIRGVWEKFTKSQGTLKVDVDKLEESANPKGATVTANVQFEGKQPIKVRYVINYRDGKIVDETWQIDPKLTISGY